MADDPIAQETRRQRHDEPSILELLDVHAGKPARIEIFTEARAQPPGNALPLRRESVGAVRTARCGRTIAAASFWKYTPSIFVVSRPTRAPSFRCATGKAPDCPTQLTDTPARPLECNCLKRTSPPRAPAGDALPRLGLRRTDLSLTAHERSATSYAEPTRKTRPACRCYLLIARSLERISKEARSACYTDPRRTPTPRYPCSHLFAVLMLLVVMASPLRSMPKTFYTGAFRGCCLATVPPYTELSSVAKTPAVEGRSQPVEAPTRFH